MRPSSIPSGILIYAAIWPQQIWAENWVGAVPLWGGRDGSPFSTIWPGPRPTCMPRFILIRPTVWPQCTNVTDRQDRTDNGLNGIAQKSTRHRCNNWPPQTPSLKSVYGSTASYGLYIHTFTVLLLHQYLCCSCVAFYCILSHIMSIV